MTFIRGNIVFLNIHPFNAFISVIQEKIYIVVYINLFSAVIIGSRWAIQCWYWNGFCR